mgnify:FL=1
MRKPKEILDDHLYLSKHGTVDEDLERNFSEDLVLLTTFGVFKGHKGMKLLAKRLREELPSMTFKYKNILVEGEVAFLEWSADSESTYVEDGADSYVIRDGKIVAQTIHYTLRHK